MVKFHHFILQPRFFEAFEITQLSNVYAATSYMVRFISNLLNRVRKHGFLSPSGALPPWSTPPAPALGLKPAQLSQILRFLLLGWRIEAIADECKYRSEPFIGYSPTYYDMAAFKSPISGRYVGPEALQGRWRRSTWVYTISGLASARIDGMVARPGTWYTSEQVYNLPNA